MTLAAGSDDCLDTDVVGLADLATHDLGIFAAVYCAGDALDGGGFCGAAL